MCFQQFNNRIGGVMIRRARLECGRSVNTKDYTIDMCCFSAKNAALK
jgi:hypothetical protein